jgi:hypothetical protein
MRGMPLKNVTFGKVFRRLALYIGLAFAALTVFVLFFALSIQLGITKEITGGWIGFFGFTGLLFWISIRQSRRCWRSWGFWFFMAGLLVLHSLAFVAVLKAYPQWRMVWFVPIIIVEAGLFAALRDAMFSGLKAFNL